MRDDVLAGGYYLVDYRGYAGYEPGDNVVHVFAMGSLADGAVEASKKLLERGIYANVIHVSSPELLFGILGHQDGYTHLREGLGVDGADGDRNIAQNLFTLLDGYRHCVLAKFALIGSRILRKGRGEES